LPIRAEIWRLPIRKATEIRNFLDEADTFHVDFKSHPVDVSFVKKNLRDYDIVHYAAMLTTIQKTHPSGWLQKMPA
jgi:HrpA-like RNA helicase